VKNLVLGVLLPAVASSIGCSSASEITARWSFTRLATNSPGQCGSASDMAVVRAQTWDPDTQTAGTSYSGSYNCAAGRGSVTLSDGTYLVWVEIRQATGEILAQSGKTVVDASLGDKTIDAGFYDDGGYFSFSWDLISKATNGRVSCKAAGSGKVEITSTSVATQMLYKAQFPCEDHFGTTQPLPLDTFTISIKALDAGASAAIGDALTLTNKSIAPNQVVDLSNIKISVP
jgi:hypothetical protein